MTIIRRFGSVLVALALAAALGGAGAAAAASDTGLAVTGFQGEWSSTSKIAASAEALTTVGVDGVTITPDGKQVGTPSADARKQLKATHRWDLPGEILVSNYLDSIGDFSEPAAYKLLKSHPNMQVVVDSLVDSVVDQGWDGVSIDLEALLDRDREGLTMFATMLDDALPAGATLTICVSLHESAGGYRRAGYDLPGLAAVVDRVILMAYDQHGPWEDTPGPVGALDWEQSGLDAMLTAVPASQIDLGVAGYGYAWRPRSTISVSDAKARKLVARDGATADWDAGIGEWTATLSDGTVIWWSDARSYGARYELATTNHLHGLAVWSLGLSDPIQPPD